MEVENLAGLEEAISAGADIVMLDNMDLEQMAEAVKAAAGRVLLEASGGMNLDRAADVAATGVGPDLRGRADPFQPRPWT